MLKTGLLSCFSSLAVYQQSTFFTPHLWLFPARGEEPGVGCHIISANLVIYLAERTRSSQLILLFSAWGVTFSPGIALSMARQKRPCYNGVSRRNQTGGDFSNAYWY